MKKLLQHELPSLVERYELKFHIPFSMLDPIIGFISPYCSIDRYSHDSGDGFYDIYSLYLDTPHFLFLRRKLADDDNRFNMRIRTYSPQTGLPCFFEVKYKSNGIMQKSRVKVSDPDWALSFENSRHPLKTVGAGEDKDKADLFTRLLHAFQAEPKILTCYRRKAFVSDVDEYARVTFDVDLQYHREERFNLAPDENRLVCYDNAAVFDPGCAVILELKCYASQVPFWMLDLIRYFDLSRSGFSKYATSIRQTFQTIGYDSDDRVARV